jgi:Na+/proline symporter
MHLHWIDISIIFLYLFITVFIGIFISKNAAKSLDAYFLGDKSIPWYILGISNASGMFDITGTVWLVSMCYMYGLKSVWLPWIWPVFNQIFLMVYLSIWLRRSNTMTGAEWLHTRFGNSFGAKLSHWIVVSFAIVSVIGFIAYGFKGIGKFAHTFFPWDLSPDMYGIIITGLTTIYIVKGGMYSVVFTELLQFVIMTLASLAVGVIAIIYISPQSLNQAVPEGWKDLFFGWKLDLDWSQTMPTLNNQIQAHGFTFFSLMVMTMLFKGILASMAGPIPNYDMQRVLATKSPKEAAKMSGVVSLVLLFPRYMMVAGLTALGLVYLSPEFKNMGGQLDLELILPYTIKNYIPVGLLGLLLAGLIAAFMSTFAATINAAPAYIVNDIYKKYINPNAQPRTYIRLSYWVSALVVVIGTAFGFVVESIDSITQWIFGALFGGYSVANLLKWHWWRFNSYGFFGGMLSGLLASLLTPILFPQTQPLLAFPFIFLISLLGSLLSTYATKPDDEEVLKAFYKQVRPWGLWQPIHQKVLAENPDFITNTHFCRDVVNIIVGMTWQISMIAMPIYLVIQEYFSFGLAFGIFLLCMIILKKNWYDKLEN